MSSVDIVILIYGYLCSWALIYLIDYGMNRKYQFISCIIALVIALLSVYVFVRGPFSNLDYGFLTLPVITVLAFNLAVAISWKKNGREYRATWQGSKHYHRKKNWVDYLMSFFIVMVQIWWPILVAVLLKK